MPSVSKVTRTMLYKRVARATGIPLDTVRTAVDSALQEVATALYGGFLVEFLGFGSFFVSMRGAGSGRDPRTGDRIPYPARPYARFRPGKLLSWEALQDAYVPPTADSTEVEDEVEEVEEDGR